MGRPKKLVTKSKKQIDREHYAWKHLHVNPRCRVSIFSAGSEGIRGEITYSRVGRRAIQERFGLDPCTLMIGWPKYAGGDTYVLAQRYACTATFVWWRHHPSITGRSDTPLGSLLGRRCWERKSDDIDKEFEFSRRQSVTEVVKAKFDRSKFKVAGEDFVQSKRRQRRIGPRCLLNPPIRKPQRRAVGAVVNIVTPEIPFAPNWREAMADAMRFVAHNREKLGAMTGAWNALAGHGDTEPEYTEPARSWVTLEKMPEGEPQRTLADYRLEWDALLDKTGRLMVQREADGRFTLAGGKSGAVRHISESYRASIAPQEMKLAA
jgi:hypothetical protein